MLGRQQSLGAIPTPVSNCSLINCHENARIRSVARQLCIQCCSQRARHPASTRKPPGEDTRNQLLGRSCLMYRWIVEKNMELVCR